MYRTNIDLTRHAIERYQQRHASHLTYEEAVASLESALPTATKLPEPSKGRRGGTQWQLHNPNVVLVTQLDPGADKHVCVTILPIRTSQGFAEDELDILLAAEETRERLAELQKIVTATSEHRHSVKERLKDPTISVRVKLGIERQASHAKKAAADAHQTLEMARLQATEIIERERTIRAAHLHAVKNEREAHMEHVARLRRALRFAVRELQRNENAATLQEIEKALGLNYTLDKFATCGGRWPLTSMQEEPVEQAEA